MSDELLSELDRIARWWEVSADTLYRAELNDSDDVESDAASGVYRETAEVLRKAIAREEGRRDFERSFAKAEPPAALRELLAACWMIEDESGGWNGADVVDIVCGMLDAAGLDLTHPAMRDGGTGDRVDCDRVELRAILGLDGGR